MWISSAWAVTREGRPGMSPDLQMFAQDCSEEESARDLGYSYRSAAIGSTRVARRAGRYVAIRATELNNSEAPINETASKGLSPNSVAASRRATPAETMTPTTKPAR